MPGDERGHWSEAWDVELGFIEPHTLHAGDPVRRRRSRAPHTHLLVTYTDRDIDNTVKWLEDQTTKAIHRATPYAGPVWCKGRWRSHVFRPEVWGNTRVYFEPHNKRRGVGPRPYAFIDDVGDA